jgi:hypothetical protein
VQRGAKVSIAGDDSHKAGWLPAVVAEAACAMLEPHGETGRRQFLRLMLTGSQNESPADTGDDALGVLARSGLVVAPARSAQEDEQLEQLCIDSLQPVRGDAAGAVETGAEPLEFSDQLEDAAEARLAEQAEADAARITQSRKAAKLHSQVQDVIPPAAEAALVALLSLMLAGVLWLRHVRRFPARQ